MVSVVNGAEFFYILDGYNTRYEGLDIVRKFDEIIVVVRNLFFLLNMCDFFCLFGIFKDYI